MERLTKVSGEMVWMKSQQRPNLILEPCEMSSFDARLVLVKLAAYEDTGLTPEEIHELTHNSYGPLHKKLGQWIDAERDGRMLVLPFGAGKEVYSIRYGEIEPATIWQVEINSYTSPAVWIRFTVRSKAFGNIDGHTRIDLAARDGIYFSREEAEAALKGAVE